MIFKTLAVTLLASVAVGAAAAPNLVTNGSFELANFSPNAEFGDAAFAGRVVTGWTNVNPNGFNLYLDATSPSTEASTRFGELGQKVSNNFTGASPDGGRFVLLDGDTNYNSAFSQVVTGLTPGHKYNVKFFWAGTQLQNRSGDTTEKLQVSFGTGPAQTTNTVGGGSQYFSGWMTQVDTFTATSGSQTLSFLSIGTPNGLPPVALLDGVSVSSVPEVATWGLLLAGMGMVGFAVRRRQSVPA